MQIGNQLFAARKHSGLSQEQVAAKLGVSRQTVSKWETDESLPDIYQAKRLANLYHLTLDELTTFDADVDALEEAITQTPAETVAKVDWTALWAKQYPVLASYPAEVATAKYTAALEDLLRDLQSTYHYSDQDAGLVLKDILGKLIVPEA